MTETPAEEHRREAREWLRYAESTYETATADDAQVTSAAVIAVAHALLALAGDETADA